MSDSIPVCDGSPDQDLQFSCSPVAVENPAVDTGDQCCSENSALPCFSQWCDDLFTALPVAKRIDVIGTNGKCIYKFDTRTPGMLMADGHGGFLFTKAPNLDLPQLLSYALHPDGSYAKNADGSLVETDPPDFTYIQIQDEDGNWKKLRGSPGKAALLIWDGDNFSMTGMEEANVSVSRPEDECAELELVGFATPTCDSGEPNLLKRFLADSDGVLYFNPNTGKVAVTQICDLFSEEAVRSSRIPFIPACSGGQSIRFRGPLETDSMLYWDSDTGEWAVMDLDYKACDPECGCSDYLVPIYNCEDGTWQITTEPDHIATWKTWSDTGVVTEIEVTLDWPAMVQIHAQRRMTPNIGDPTVVSADIYVDGCKVTSPSDGGLVATLGEATTSTGLAMVPLAKGTHRIYVSNTQIAGTGTPQWTGAWMKVYAHKITTCVPTPPPIGDGTITTGTGGGGTGPAGPTGADGVVGPIGEPGIDGADGIDGETYLYKLESCETGYSLIWKIEIDDDLKETTFFTRSVRGEGCLIVTEDEPCVLTFKLSPSVACYPDHTTGVSGDPWEPYIAAVRPDDEIGFIPVCDSPVSADTQYWLFAQEPSGVVSTHSLSFPSAPATGNEYYVFKLGSGGDLTAYDLETALSLLGFAPVT